MSETSSRTSHSNNEIKAAAAEKSVEDGLDAKSNPLGKDKEEGNPGGLLAEPPSEQPVVDQRPNYSAFTEWEKRGIVLGAAIGAFFSPLTAQIYLPALTVLAQEFHVTTSQINLTVTTYMVR